MPEDAGGPGESIPEVLHSTESGRPFDRCSDCGAELRTEGRMHLIEKVIRQGEVVFEYAICSECAAGLMRQYSEESLANITAYVEREGISLRESDDPGRCGRCGRDGEAFEEEHTVAGLVLGQVLTLNLSSLCAACTEGIEEILSQKTREVHGDFVRRNFPGVPEGLDLPIGVVGA